ncbi:MAG: squalene synthase HpnC [Rhodospirillaceae bacterium]|nr:squalene synthase HpnC [Rhodospirillaceae bacterium]MBT5659469.1 squalene synthase HpnC [Rhodospirillaceae bacterium]
MTSHSDAIEAPSGKGATDENFPVGSWLLPAHMRRDIGIYYAFARATDDIADDPGLASQDKITRLNAFDSALTGHITDDPRLEKATQLRKIMVQKGISTDHGSDLLIAFRQDATKHHYRDWDDLIGYCINSAAPVGRYLIDLHGESPDTYPASNALCNALQILNHLQDCQKDFRELDRVYLPGDWMEKAGVSEADLDAPFSTPGLRQVLDQCLDGVEELLVCANQLPGQIKYWRLALESAVICRIAGRLMRRLRHQDPLAGRVELNKFDYFLCAAEGAFQTFFRR